MQIHDMWYEQLYFLFLFPNNFYLGFGTKLCVGVGSNGLGINPGGNEPSYLGWWGMSNGKKKKT